MMTTTTRLLERVGAGLPLRFRSATVRAPCQPPRLRRFEAGERQMLCERVRDWLGLDITARLDVDEWIAMDARCVAHLTVIRVEDHHGTNRIAVEKAGAKLTESDLGGATAAYRRTSRVRRPRASVESAG
ncbi:MAG: hypothetical protein IAG13_20175 [Deltaproteobacteria bacterium]|nr:hypothetical protein [Nannocystaceae bacterium]